MEFAISPNSGYVPGEPNCFDFHHLKKKERISFVLKGLVRIEEMPPTTYVMQLCQLNLRNDAMVHLSGESMESLDDNIGVDHVMCSRLIGRGGKSYP